VPLTAHRPPPLPKIEYERPKLTRYQLDAIFCPERYAVVEATTKSGKTAGCMAWQIEQAISARSGSNHWWVAPILAQARIPFRRVRRGLPPDACKVNETELTLTLPNGAVWWFKGADHPDSLYGEDVYSAVIDEASRCKEDAWHAVRSTLTATRGPIRIIGNVKGRRNWAYQLARRAEAGDADMHYAKITAIDAIKAGILHTDEVDDARRQLPDNVFRELYMAEPSDDAGNPFGYAAILACIGPLHQACEPEFWGWDLAKSVDWTVGIALCTHGAVCRFHRFQKPWTETLQTIGAMGPARKTLVDSTGVGDPILETLQRANPRYEGYKFTQQSKQQLMEGLAVVIQQQRVTYPDGPIPGELEEFEYVYSRSGVHYSAPEGLYDDCVCALALAISAASRPRGWGAV
jgi:hypothetical protein